MRDVTLGKTLPHSKDAERSVLGAIIIDNRTLDTAQEVLTPDDFYSLSHRKIYTAAADLCRRGVAVDPLTLKAELGRRGDLDEVGGQAFLFGLMDGVHKSSNIQHYAENIKEHSRRRDLIRAGLDIASKASDGVLTAQEVLEEAQKQIFGITDTTVRSGFAPLMALGQRTLDRLDRLHATESTITGVPTGFRRLDSYTAGLQSSDLILLAARPSQGKTALALDIARNAAEEGKRVGIFSLEMSSDQLFVRMLCSQGKIDAQRLRTGRCSQEEWGDIVRAYAALMALPIHVDDTPALTVFEMRAKARRLKAEVGLDLLVLDYLQLMRSKVRGGGSRYEEVTEISHALKALAKELDIPVLALSQLSRAPDQRGKNDHKPQLSDLRDSGALEQDADVVMFIYREEVYKPTEENKGLATIMLEKQRNGPTGRFKLAFNRDCTRFDNFGMFDEE